MVKYSSLTAGFLREQGIYANLVLLSEPSLPLDCTVYLDAKPILTGRRLQPTAWELEAFPIVPETLTRLAGKRPGRSLSELRRSLWSELCKLSRSKALRDQHLIAWESVYLQDLCQALVFRTPSIAKDLLEAAVAAAQDEFGEVEDAAPTRAGQSALSRLCGYSSVESRETDCLLWRGSSSHRVPIGLIRQIRVRDRETSEELALFSKGRGRRERAFVDALDCLMSRYAGSIDPMTFYAALSEGKLLEPGRVRGSAAKRYLYAIGVLMRRRAELRQAEREKQVLVSRF